MLIKYDRALDTCFEVVARYEGNTHYKVKGFWWNMGFCQSWRIFSRPTTIEIAKEDWPNWQKSFETNECLRNNNWR